MMKKAKTAGGNNEAMEELLKKGVPEIVKKVKLTREEKIEKVK